MIITQAFTEYPICSDPLLWSFCEEGHILTSALASAVATATESPQLTYGRATAEQQSVQSILIDFYFEIDGSVLWHRDDRLTEIFLISVANIVFIYYIKFYFIESFNLS